MFLLYFIYTILIAIIGSIALIIGGLSTLIISFIYPPFTYPMIKGFAKTFVVCLGVKVKIEGQFPEDGPYIIIGARSAIFVPLSNLNFTRALLPSHRALFSRLAFNIFNQLLQLIYLLFF